jgi:hypothetical protein
MEDLTDAKLADEANKAEVEFVKSLFHITKRPVNSRMTWFAWQHYYFREIKLTPYGLECAQRPSETYKACRKVQESEFIYVCHSCWVRDRLPPDKMLVKVNGRNVGNGNSHFITQHESKGDILPGMATYAGPLTPAPAKVKNKKQHLITDIQHNPSTISDPQVAMGYLYKFFNEANVAKSQSNNPNLRCFVDYILDHSQNFSKKRNEIYFSRGKYDKQENLIFSQFISNLRIIVEFCRSWYNDGIPKANIPFIYVSHDNWDSKDHDVLGVSIHFIVPVFWKQVSVAVGLKRVQSKASRSIAEGTIAVLNR